MGSVLTPLKGVPVGACIMIQYQTKVKCVKCVHEQLRILDTVVWKFFDRSNFIDEKFKVNIFVDT